VQQGSFTLSASALNFFNCPSPQTLVITNTSSMPLTWHVSGNLTNLSFSPLGSTLDVGAAVNVSVVPTLGTLTVFTTLSIDADVASSQSINIGASLDATIVPPPDLDFGNVPIGGVSPPIFISAFATATYPGESIISSNQDFSLSGNAPNTQVGGFGWTVSFRPSLLGAQQSTITYFSMSGSIRVCPPNTFIVRGVGVSP
jgi:hypothetical protein